MAYRLTRLSYGLVDTLIESQVSYNTNNVPLDLQGVSTKLINPLEELQTPIGNYVVTVALDLQTRCNLMGESTSLRSGIQASTSLTV